MKLRGLAAERGDADRVLEEAARVAVVPVGARGGQPPHGGPDLRVSDERVHDGDQPRMGNLGGKELEEAVELVGIAAERGRELGQICVVYRLDRPHLHLQPSAEAFYASEDPHRVAFAEPLVEKVDVAPHACFDPTARVGELQRQVGRARPRPASLLLRDGEHALHGSVFGELGDRGHG